MSFCLSDHSLPPEKGTAPGACCSVQRKGSDWTPQQVTRCLNDRAASRGLRRSAGTTLPCHATREANGGCCLCSARHREKQRPNVPFVRTGQRGSLGRGSAGRRETKACTPLVAGKSPLTSNRQPNHTQRSSQGSQALAPHLPPYLAGWTVGTAGARKPIAAQLPLGQSTPLNCPVPQFPHS